jgi:hypothetical protein
LNTLAKAAANGWLFSPTTINPQRGVLFRTPDSELPASQNWPFAPIGSQRLTSAPIVVALPPVYLPASETHEANADANTTKLEKYLAGGSLRLVVKARLKGYGQVVPVISVICAVSRIGQSDELIQWSAGGIATTGEKTLAKLSTPLQLWGDKIEQVIWQETLPCVPRSARLLLQAGRQNQITLEERLHNPERQRLGFLDVHTAEVTLAGGNGPDNIIAIPLQIRPVSADLPKAIVSNR